jgi:hypothetical protein
MSDLQVGRVDFGKCSRCDKPATHFQTMEFRRGRGTLESEAEPLCNYCGALSPKLLFVAHTETGITMPQQIDGIKISKGGVWVGDKEMKGCVGWEIVRDCKHGITEVCLRLVTPSLDVEFKAPSDHPNRIL